MRIGVIGAGAMGGTFGARLAEAGHDLVLVDVSPNVVSAIEQDGLRLTENGEERAVDIHATVDPAGEEPADAVVFFVKNYHTESATKLAAPLVDADTTICSLQNGWGNGETLARAFDPARIVVGVTYHSATVLGAGQVAHMREGPTLIGPYDSGSCDRADAVASALTETGFAVDVTATVRTEIWKKLVLNAATLPTAALTRLTVGALGDPGPMLELVDALAAEAVAVANASGMEIDLDERIEVIHAALSGGGTGKASMLQDVEANRRTEIEVINGAIVREGERNGIDVPLNVAMCALIGGLERGLELR